MSAAKEIKDITHDEREWWDRVETAASASIKRGLKQAKKGNVIPHEEVMKKYGFLKS